jgi:glycosyltransferase involved in cell wall biosynthesis
MKPTAKMSSMGPPPAGRARDPQQCAGTAAMTPAPFLSFIVSSHNRKALLCRTLTSVHEFRLRTGCRSECILVDDGSTDGTAAAVTCAWGGEMAGGDFRLVFNAENLGVTAAKNIGAAHARGRWLIFVDSDDLLVPEAAGVLTRTLAARGAFPIVFFRCRVLETGTLMGPPIRRGYPLDLRSFLNHGTPGECLPAVQAQAFRRCPYASALRGGEGLAYAGIMEAFGPAWVSPLVIRRYRTANADRLSGPLGLRRRACALARYHAIFLKRFHAQLAPDVKALTLLKALYHGSWCGIQRLTRGR